MMAAAFAAQLRQNPFIAVLWLLILLLAYVYAASDIGYALAHGDWHSSPSTMLGRDFVNVYTAGWLSLEGDLARIYDVPCYQDFQARHFGEGVSGHNYSYPPISFFFTWLFALLPYGMAYLVWIGLTGTAFVLAARPYLKEAGVPAWLALLLPAAVANIWAGHYGFLIAALWLAGWRLLETKPRLAGILFGLLAVKPHIALLLPVVLAWRGAWVPFRYAAFTVSLLVIASGFLFGWNLWATYVTDTLLFQASLLDQSQAFYMRMMPSVVPSLGLAGAPPALAWTIQVIAAAGALAALLRWMPRDSAMAGLACAAATALVLPYSFNYDMAAVGVLALLLVHGAPPEGYVQRAIGAAALLLPLLLPFLGGIGLPLGPAILLLLLGATLRASAAGGDEAARAPVLRFAGRVRQP